MDTTQDLRALRSFVQGTWNGGGADQTYAGQDGYAVNPTRMYQSIGPNGAVGVEGAPVSTQQTTASVFSVQTLAIIGVVAAVGFFLLKKA